MVEMSVRQHYRFNVAEIQAHPGNVAFESVWIRAGVEKDGSRLCAKSGGHRKRKPVVRRTKPFSRQLLHPCRAKDPQFRSNMRRTRGEHIATVVDNY